MSKKILERLGEFLVNPDFSSKGPFAILGLEKIRDQVDPDGFEIFADTVKILAEEYGCEAEVRERTINQPNDQFSHHQILSVPTIVTQLFVSPGSGQSIASFEQSLAKITAELTNPENIKDSAEIAGLAAQFSHKIQKALLAKKHGQYSF